MRSTDLSPSSKAKAAAQATPRPVTRGFSPRPYAGNVIAHAPVGLASPREQRQQQRASTISRTVTRAYQGKPGTNLADVQRYGFQGTAGLESNVQHNVQRQKKLDGLINKAAMGAHPSQFMPQMKAMKLTPEEKSYASSETARRGNINIARAQAADPWSSPRTYGLIAEGVGKGLGHMFEATTRLGTEATNPAALAAALAIQGPRGTARQASQDLKTISQINVRHPLDQGPWWLIGNAAMAAVPDLGVISKAGRAVGLGARAARAAEWADRGAVGADVPIHTFDEAKTARSLRARLNPRYADSGQILNARVRRGGQHVLGDITPQAWIKRADSVHTPEDVHKWARWYDEVKPLFDHVFGADSERVLRGFSASQANASPTSGLEATLKVIDKLRAGKTIHSREISAVVKGIEAGVKGQPIEKGIAAKLSDFIDSLQGAKTRTWMGHAPEGGAPTAIDVHALRDLGWVDSKLAGKLKKNFGLKQGKDFQIDSTGVASGARYERAVRKYQQITDYANKIGWHGRSDWTPRELQAVGWAGIQKFHGVEPQDLSMAIQRNTRTFSIPGAHPDDLRATVEGMGGYVQDAHHGSVSAVTSPGNMRAIGRQLARDHGASRAMWLSNKSKARHWQITIPHGNLTRPVLQQLRDLGFTEAHASSRELTLVGARGVGKSRLDFAKAEAIAKSVGGHGGLTQMEEFGARGARSRAAAARGEVLDRALGDGGRPVGEVGGAGKPGLLDHIDSAIHHITGGSTGTLSSGFNIGRNIAAEGEHGLLVSGAKAVGRGVKRLIGEERGAIGPLEQPAEEAPVEIPKGLRMLRDRQIAAVTRIEQHLQQMGAEDRTFVEKELRRRQGLLAKTDEKIAALGKPPEIPPAGPQTLGEAVGEAVQAAKPDVRAQQRGYTPHRAGIIEGAQKAQEDVIAGGGSEEAALQKYRAAFAGEYPKLHFSGFEHLGGSAEKEAILRKIRTSPMLDAFQSGNAREAVMRAYEGHMPRPFEVKLLEKVFPPADVSKLVVQAEHEEKKWKLWSDLLQIPRTMQSSTDVSALFRQALPVLTKRPDLWWQSIMASRGAITTRGEGVMAALTSDKAFRDWLTELAKDPAYAQFKSAGGAITKLPHADFQGGLHVEEAYGSALAEKLPLVGHSARQYTAYLDDLRLRMWKQYLPKTERDALKQIRGKGLSQEQIDQHLTKAHEDLARYINSMTGRGPLPGQALQSAAGALNAMFFSPRLLASRLDLLFSPVTYARATPFVRRQAIRSALQLLGVGVGVLYAAKKMGMSVGLDPTSADFGKIKVGDTRIDIWGGFRPIVVLLAQMKAGYITSSVSGKKEPLNTRQFGGQTDLAIFGRFLREKFSPNASFIADWLSGSDVVGQKFKWSQQWRRLIPMLAGDLIDTATYKGPHAPLGVVGAANVLGMGTATYGSRKNQTSLPSNFQPSQFQSGGFTPSQFTPSK